MFGVLCSLAFSHWVTVAHLPGGPSGAKPPAERHYHQAQAEKKLAAGEGKKAGAYDPGCPYPKDREDADLCEQRRMAKAAEDAVALADKQFWSNVAQTFFTAFAAIAAAYAAIEAGRAARAASAAVHAERAWMSSDGIEGGPCTDITINGVYFPTGYAVGLKWKNSGRSPAVRTHIFSDHRIVKASEPTPRFDHLIASEEEDRFGVVGPGLVVVSPRKAVSGGIFEKVESGELVWFVYARATYETALDLGKEHYSEICATVQYQGRVRQPDGSIVPLVTLSFVGPQNAAT